MTATLNVAPGLRLPLDAVTETFAFLAVRGVGKTHNASVMVEEMLGVGAQVVVIDPLDAWWGLRSSADGKKPGVPIYVFGAPGSDHSDLTLEPGAGSLLADVVVDEGISVVLSLRHMSKAKARQFVAEFAERLYHRKGEQDRRTPLHVVIDEADAYVPQRLLNSDAYAARAHGSIDDLVRRGRSSGIGVTLISQRAAVISKDVLTQCSVLVALRTTSKQDRKALDEWIEAHDPGDRRAEFMQTIANLDVGEAWVWSPGWLDVFVRVKFRRRTTFDSSATPKAGETVVIPKARAAVDLDALGARMAATIEQADARDPVKLRAKIAELEQALAVQPAALALAPPEPDPALVEYVATVEQQNFDLRRECADKTSAITKMVTYLDDLGKRSTATATELAMALERGSASATEPPFRPAAPTAPPQALPAAPAPTPPRTPAVPPASQGTGAGAPSLGKGMPRDILRVLAQFQEGRTRTQVALFIGRKASGGGFQNAVRDLRKSGWLDPGPGDPLRITTEGLLALGEYTTLPTGEALLDFWLAKVGKPGSMPHDILAALVVGTRRGVVYTPAQVAEIIGRTATGGGYQNAYRTLRGHGLLNGHQLDPEFAAAIGVA